jgi:hypothetical protein
MRSIIWIALFALTLVGCSSSEDTGNNPPPGTTHTESEPNDSAPQAFGVLDSTDIVVGGNSASNADIDLYSVTLSAPAALYVQLAWSGGQNLGVAVSNEDGIFVRNVDSGSNVEECTVIGLGAGTYRVRVGSQSTSSADYLLTIGARE